MAHKAGFVNIVGNPNVGKSTLMNLLVGERISIATFKAQTTRHRIMGILNTPDMQICFSDTPGVLKPNYKLQEQMLQFSESALQDADVLLYVTDMVETPDKNADFLEKVKKLQVPVLVLVNKIDLGDQATLTNKVEEWHAVLPAAEILPISALHRFNVDNVLKRICELLPESPAYFDKDADIYSVEILAAGPEVHRQTIYELLAEKTHCRGIYERCDSEVRKKEGLPLRTGTVFGEVPDEPVIINENGILFPIDVKNGHKTGYYLDQRDARRRIGELSKGKKVLNCFCYTGGFGLYALRGGCEKVYQVDVSKDALKLAKDGIMRNKLSTAHATHVEADVFQYLRRCRDKAETFDLIVLDPPKFVESKDNLQKGARGYKDINLLAMKLLAEGGMLATFSCSGLMEMDLFQKIVADAAADAKRHVQIIERFGQPADHPVSTAFPEGQYLKGLLVQVV